MPYFDFGMVATQSDYKNPESWTVDKERNIYLLTTSYIRGYSDENVFIFIWNQKNYLVQFRISIENNRVVWNIPNKYFIDNTFPYCMEEHFIDDLREAMHVHGVDGHNLQNANIACNF